MGVVGKSYCAGEIEAGESSENKGEAALQTQEAAEGRAGGAPAPQRFPSPPGKSVVGQLCLLPGAPGGSTVEQEGSKEAVSWWEGHTAGKVLAGPVDY